MSRAAAWGLYVYPTPSTVVEREVLFGNRIALRGFALVSPVQPDQFRPRQAICLILQWQALANLTTDYAVFIHLVGPENPATQSSIWAQGDSIPAYGARPTST